MGVSVTPAAAANLADNPKNRLYRATQSGTYNVNIPVGIYEVTRQATTNIIIGSTTVAPSTATTLVFINTPQSEITFQSAASTTAVVWTSGSGYYDVPGRMDYIDRIYYLENQYIATNINGQSYWVSTNGRIWVRRLYGANIPDAHNPRSLTIDDAGTRYVQLHLNAATNQSSFVRHGTNLVNWATVTIQNAAGLSWHECFYVGNRYVGIGRRTTDSHGVVVSTTNGALWNVDPVYIGPLQGWTAGDYNGSIIVAGSQVGTMMISTNGLTWTFVNSRFGGNSIDRVIFADNKWVAGGQNGTMSQSTDGTTWTNINAGIGTTRIYNIVYNPDDGVWLITDFSNFMRISTDLVTWTLRTPPGNFRDRSLIYAGGQYVMTQAINDTNFRSWTTQSLLVELTVSSFADTYIILEYKGKQKTLA